MKRKHGVENNQKFAREPAQKKGKGQWPGKK